MNTRPSRSALDLYGAAQHWLQRPDWPDYPGNLIGLGEPFCAACGWLAPVAPRRDGERGVRDLWARAHRFLDAAHLVDRMEFPAFGAGLDGPQNLVPLCAVCHDRMPSFHAGDEESALTWARSQPRRSLARQLLTDDADWGRRDPASCRREAHRLYTQSLEVELAVERAVER